MVQAMRVEQTSRPNVHGSACQIRVETGVGNADSDGPVILEPRRVVEIGCRKILNFPAEAEFDGLVHRTVIDDGDVYLLIAFLRLQLGQSVGGIASNIFDLDAMLLLEVRDRRVDGHGLPALLGFHAMGAAAAAGHGCQRGVGLARQHIG